MRTIQFILKELFDPIREELDDVTRGLQGKIEDVKEPLLRLNDELEKFKKSQDMGTSFIT